MQERHTRQVGENQANWKAIENVNAHANKSAFDDLAVILKTAFLPKA